MRHRQKQPTTIPAAYRIQVQGCIDPHWSDWFAGLTLVAGISTSGPPITVLSGVLPDQPALRGVLNKLWDLNLTLLAVERLPLPVESEKSDERRTDPTPDKI